MIHCKRCGTSIRTFSPMRKWCVDCRRTVNLEQARQRKTIIAEPGVSVAVEAE